MARFASDPGMLLYIEDGDGVGGMKAVGTKTGTFNSQGDGVAVWNSNSTLDDTSSPTSTPGTASAANRTFTVGETVTYGHEVGFWQKTGTFRGIYEASDGTTYVVIHDTNVYSDGHFVLIGPEKTGSAKDAITNDFDESKIKVEDFGNFIVVCFLPGTLIAAPDGERKVETLAAGDMILTAEGRHVPVKWIGRQTVSTLFGPAERLTPVRFAAGSLGGGGGGPPQPLLPHSGLTVTSDHAMLVDGVLCQASALVNGATVTRVPLSEFGKEYTVYHVETERHEIILANGAPAETFIDNVSRRAFDNYAEFEALFGENPPEMEELPHPRASNDRQLPRRIRARFGLGGAYGTAKVA